jgi:hypothetical protein
VCFAPQADLVGGLAITAIGVDAVRHVDHRPGHVALASLPLILGVHQVIEAFVWWGLQGEVPPGVGHAALWAYLLIAFVFLPVYIPLAVFTLERAGPRRWRLAPFVVIGTIVALTLLVAMLRGPVQATLGAYHLDYCVGQGVSLPLTVLYIAAVCGSLLLSGHRMLILFGAANLVVLPVLGALTASGFASLWCAYAAVVSGVIALYMRRGKRPHPSFPEASAQAFDSPGWLNSG